MIMRELDSPGPQRVRDGLLRWYDRHARSMPWRVAPAARANGERPDPYHVWLSEIMLQQTQVATVKRYFDTFVRRWPDVASLAAAPVDDVMAAWAGLGYYSRARNLKKCADTVLAQYGGNFPRQSTALIELPGIGTYTAAAIAAIAFDEQIAVVDGNVERVITRLHAIAKPVRAAKAEIRSLTAAMVPTDRPGDFAQAMMDLGATICTPRKPACVICPVSRHCLARQSGSQQAYPVPAPKRQKPLRRGAAFIARRISDGALLLQKRPPTGMLGGMATVPTSDWAATRDGATEVDAAPFMADWQKKGAIRHSFTHFDLELIIYMADVETAKTGTSSWWSDPHRLGAEALPSVVKKAIEAAISIKVRRMS